MHKSNVTEHHHPLSTTSLNSLRNILGTDSLYFYVKLIIFINNVKTMLEIKNVYIELSFAGEDL